MLKAIDKGTHISKDDYTGEPVAIIHRYKVRGGDDKVKTEWHPHILALHPELNNIIHQQPITNTKENADYVARKYVNDFRDGKGPEHTIGIEKNDDDTRTVHLKRSDGTVIASFKGGNARYNSLGHDRLSDPVFNYASSPILSQDKADTAHAKIRRRTGDALTISNIRELAPHIEAAAVSKGPRFKGEIASKATSSNSVYSSQIKNPREAIRQYMETNVPVEHRSEVHWPSENIAMTSSANDDHNHIIKFKDGKIHHTKTYLDRYSDEPLTHVIESVQVVEWDDEKIKAAWKKTANQSDAEYKAGIKLDPKVHTLLNDETPEARARFNKAKAEFRLKNHSYA